MLTIYCFFVRYSPCLDESLQKNNTDQECKKYRVWTLQMTTCCLIAISDNENGVEY